MREKNAGCGEGSYETALGFVEGRVGHPNRLCAIGGGDGLNAVGRKMLGSLGIDEGFRPEIVEIEIGIENVDATVRFVISGDRNFCSLLADSPHPPQAPAATFKRLYRTRAECLARTSRFGENAPPIEH